MPLAHNLKKVSKNASKSTAAIHIKGRKFKQLNRATLRDKKLQHRKALLHERKSNELSVVFHIQAILKEQRTDATEFTLEEIKEMIAGFIERDAEELERLRSERRKGRPATNRQTLLEEKVKHEWSVFETGFKVPDLSDPVTVERVREWNGTTGATTNMKFIRISKDMTEFPTQEVEMK
ncbi:Translation machinery-associated protein 16 [Candida viswanathii]|uniref:Translation machinery-associated protein 16 n=1 Tax=Candida viswanathii TaxID=5486 RepID=A0A367YDC0_9ASCO|nr:Translation machinery-associated protein 16 [Candida viswanathii]